MTKPRAASDKTQLMREKIIEAAIRIIASRGIDKATTRAISKEAKVANGSITLYLKSQDELFNHVIEYIAAAAYREIEAAPETIPPLNRILWMCEKNIDFFLAHPDYAKCFLLFYYYASFEAPLKTQNDLLQKRAILRLESYFNEHFTDSNSLSDEYIRNAAVTIHSQIISAVIYYYTVPQKTPQADFRKEFLNRCQSLVHLLAQEQKPRAINSSN